MPHEAPRTRLGDAAPLRDAGRGRSGGFAVLDRPGAPPDHGFFRVVRPDAAEVAPGVFAAAGR